MRIKKEYGKRTAHFSEKQNVKMKYIIAFEGEKTELQYFEGIINNRDKLNVNGLLEIIPLQRGIASLSISHPIRTLEQLLAHVESYNSPIMLIDKIVDFCFENRIYCIMDPSNLREHFVKEYARLFPERDIAEEIEDRGEVIRSLIESSSVGSFLIKQIDQIIEYIEKQEITYIPEYDQVCLIIDRDCGSFSLEQLEEVISICNKNKITLYLSNPNFEFWLLLHCRDIFKDGSFKYSEEDLLKNEKVNGKRYLEGLLSKHFNGYNKTNIRFEERFMPFIRDAINHAREFPRDINRLKEYLGTNVGVLVEELLGEHYPISKSIV